MIKILNYAVIISAIMVSASSALTVERCAMTFSACPETFNHDTIVVPKNVVALAPTILACRDTAVIESTATTGVNSFFFVIDNSGSMSTSDATGARFNVTRALIDTIYKKQPNAQIGIAVFESVLYFDLSTTATYWYTQYFQGMQTVYDNQPNQAYMPLLTLNQDYNGHLGKDILDSLLVTTGTGRNLALRYKPTFSLTVGQATTNINIGFLAARQAFANSTTPKENQYIVFLSDGEANLGQNDPGPDSIYYFRDSTRNVPTTFTVFFNSNGTTTVPGSIDTMTMNIKANGYSSSNPNSADYAIDANFTNLMSVLVSNVVNRISVPAVPVTMVLNNITSSSYSNGVFVFPDSFFLSSNVVTSYTMSITYEYTDKVGVKHDTITNTVFYVRQSTSTVIDTPPGVVIYCSSINVPVSPIPVTATFLDTNHDGKLDEIIMTWSDTDAIRRNMPAIAQWIKTLNITLQDGSVVNLQAATLVPDLANKTIHVILTQDNGSKYETAWKNAIFTLTDTAMSLGGRPFSVTQIIDGAAPVIKSVCFVPASAADSLRVTFSEPVTPTSKPGNKNTFFTLIKGNGTALADTAKLVLDQGDLQIYVYQKGELNDSMSVKEGARPLFPLELCNSVSIVTGYHVASNPFKPGQTVIPPNQRDPNNPTITTGTRIEISLIPAILQDIATKKVTATVSIFDAVGNTIVNKLEMFVDLKDPKHPKLARLWDGKTSKGKIAGGGTYMARIVVNDQARNTTQTLTTYIGLKQ